MVQQTTSYVPQGMPASGISHEMMVWVERLFFLFLMLVMVRISSGAADSDDSRLARQAATANGDVVKQIAYLFAFITFCVLWLMHKGLQLPKSASVPQLLVLCWILCSTLWAYDQNLAFRRSILLIFVFCTLTFAIDFMGTDRTMKILYRMLALCMTVSLVSVFLFPSFAVHPATEVDQSIVGGWRGIFIHKNTAGGVCAMALILFLHFAVNRGRWSDWFFLAVCTIFLIGCKAKTPLGLLIIVIPLGFLYRLAWRSLTGKLLSVLGIVGAAVFAMSVALEYSEVITKVFSDPTSFTGRVAIWDTALAYWKDHWLLGSGYSSLWATSVDPPPIFQYMRNPYLEFIVHSHSGYLEMLGTTGVPGLTLAVIAVVLVPAYQFIFKVGRENSHVFSMMFSIWLFGLLENIMETQLYTRDREMWVTLFCVILALQFNVSSGSRNTGEGTVRRYAQVN